MTIYCVFWRFSTPSGSSVWAISAAKRGKSIAEKMKNPPQIGQILHPSPASPAANRGWAQKATEQMIALGVWKG